MRSAPSVAFAGRSYPNSLKGLCPDMSSQSRVLPSRLAELSLRFTGESVGCAGILYPMVIFLAIHPVDGGVSRSDAKVDEFGDLVAVKIQQKRGGFALGRRR